MKKAHKTRIGWILAAVGVTAAAAVTIAVVAKAKSTSTTSSTTNSALSASQFTFSTQTMQLQPGTTYRVAFRNADIQNIIAQSPTDDAAVLDTLDSMTPLGVANAPNATSGEITVSTIQHGSDVVVVTFTTSAAGSFGGSVGDFPQMPYGT